METIPRSSVTAQPVNDPAMHTVTPLAARSFGHAILICTKHALAVKLDNATASNPDIIVLVFIFAVLFSLSIWFFFVVSKAQSPNPRKTVLRQWDAWLLTTFH